MNVYIVGGGRAYENMFLARGWTIVQSLGLADLIQFTGGEDVSPFMYGEKSHPTTHSCKTRDEHELHIYENHIGNTPMAGICRGGQFLNVVNGGKLYQDVDRHAIGNTHHMKIVGGDTIQVTSTHHQMMRAGLNGEVLAYGARSTVKEHMGDEGVVRVEDDEHDVEVVYYAKTKSLCFQPHPEFERAPQECTDYYFKLIEEMM